MADQSMAYSMSAIELSQGLQATELDNQALVLGEEASSANLSSTFGEMHTNLRYMDRAGLGMMGMMTTLSLSIPGLSGKTGDLQVALEVMVGAMGVFELLKGATEARRAWETTQAYIEAAAAALAQNWVGLAIAGAAAASVYATFEVSSGEWNFNADLSTGKGQRQAAQATGGAVFSG